MIQQNGRTVSVEKSTENCWKVVEFGTVNAMSDEWQCRTSIDKNCGRNIDFDLAYCRIASILSLRLPR